MPAAAAIGPDGTILRPRKGRPPKGGYPYPYPASTDPARTIYIGKNNARHWADLKQRLGYNGDVDFVSFLLRLAEERLSQEEQLFGTSLKANQSSSQSNGRSEYRSSSAVAGTSDLEHGQDQEGCLASRHVRPREDPGQGKGHEEEEDDDDEEATQKKKLKMEESADDDQHDEYDFHEAPSSAYPRQHHNGNNSGPHYGTDMEDDLDDDDEADLSRPNTSTGSIPADHEQAGEFVCNFCNKSFLRPTYLNLHRTYGCPANPERCRPQCHLCGKDFSQPQSLKAHIEAEHKVEYPESLTGGLASPSSHPCKACPAVFTSRAALRRHLGEVHGQGASGACVCDQCGKLFQTKSNLKIHLLTHSGVKPFKCPETECALGFSTKQCLQVHLRKAHGYSEENMPQVQRTIPYTFDAYSGGIVKDPGRGKLPDAQRSVGSLSESDGSNTPGTPRSYPVPEAPRRGRKPGWRKVSGTNQALGMTGSSLMPQGSEVPNDLLHSSDSQNKLRDLSKEDISHVTGALPSFSSSAAAVVAELAIQSLAAAAAAAAAAGNDSSDNADLNSPTTGATALNYHNSPGSLPITPEPQAMALNLAASRNQANYNDYPPASPSPWQQPQQQHFEDNYPALARPQPVNARSTPGPQQQFYPERPSSCYSFSDGGQQTSYSAQHLLQAPGPSSLHSYGGGSSSSGGKLLLPPASPNPTQDLSRCGTPLNEPSFPRFSSSSSAASTSSASRCTPASSSPGSSGAGTSSTSNPYPSPAPSPGYPSVTSRVFSGSYGLQNWGNVNMQGLSSYSQTYSLPPPSPYPRNPYGGYY